MTLPQPFPVVHDLGSVESHGLESPVSPSDFDAAPGSGHLVDRVHVCTVSLRCCRSGVYLAQGKSSLVTADVVNTAACAACVRHQASPVPVICTLFLLCWDLQKRPPSHRAECI